MIAGDRVRYTKEHLQWVAGSGDFLMRDKVGTVVFVTQKAVQVKWDGGRVGVVAMSALELVGSK